MKIILKLLFYYRGVPKELPYEEDSADLWSVKDNVGKNIQLFGPIDPVSRWQLNQPAEKAPDPSDGELNNQ